MSLLWFVQLNKSDCIFENVKFIVTCIAITKADSNNVFKLTKAGVKLDIFFFQGFSELCYFSSLMLYVTE